MRVLLFVEREGRVVCAGSIVQGGPAKNKRVNLGDSCYGSSKMHAMLYAASRWWLVQAADADAGRWTIHWHLTKPTAQIGDTSYPLTGPGQILASGGKA